MKQADLGLAPAVQRLSWLMLFVSWLVQTSVYFGGMATGPIAPFLQEDLHITRAEVGFLASAFSAGTMLTLLPTGWLADRFGVRLLLALGPAFSGLFFVAAGRASSYWMVVLAVLVAGLGAGVATPAATKAVMDWFAARTRGTAMGIKQTGTSLGGAVAAATLPAVALAASWRDAIALVGLVNVGVAVLCYLVYRDVVVPKVSAVAKPRGSLRAVLADRDVRLTCLTGLCFSAAQLAVATYLVLYLKEALGMEVAAAGGLLALAQMSGVAGRIVLGIGSDRLLGGRRREMIIFTGVGSLAAAAVMALAGSSLPALALTLVMLVFGFTGMAYTGVFMTLISELSGKEATGIGSAVGLAACNFGTLVGPPLFGLLIDRTSSYPLGWGAVALTAGLGTLLIWPVRERRG